MLRQPCCELTGRGSVEVSSLSNILVGFVVERGLARGDVFAIAQWLGSLACRLPPTPSGGFPP